MTPWPCGQSGSRVPRTDGVGGTAGGHRVQARPPSCADEAQAQAAGVAAVVLGGVEGHLQGRSHLGRPPLPPHSTASRRLRGAHPKVGAGRPGHGEGVGAGVVEAASAQACRAGQAVVGGLRHPPSSESRACHWAGAGPHPPGLRPTCPEYCTPKAGSWAAAQWRCSPRAAATQAARLPGAIRSIGRCWRPLPAPRPCPAVSVAPCSTPGPLLLAQRELAQPEALHLAECPTARCQFEFQIRLSNTKGLSWLEQVSRSCLPVPGGPLCLMRCCRAAQQT